MKSEKCSISGTQTDRNGHRNSGTGAKDGKKTHTQLETEMEKTHRKTMTARSREPEVRLERGQPWGQRGRQRQSEAKEEIKTSGVGNAGKQATDRRLQVSPGCGPPLTSIWFP